MTLLLLGFNAWIACNLWPVLVSGDVSPTALALAALPLVPLGVGVGAPPRRGRSLRTWWLLFAVPVAAVGVRCLQLGASERAGGTAWLAISALSLLGYGAGAARACRVWRSPLDTSVRPLGDDPWDAPAAALPLQRAVTVLMALGAFVLLVVGATWGGAEELERAWGPAAAEGGLLTAVVAAGIAVAVVATFLGGTLRSRKPPTPPPTDTSLRVASLLLAALVGATLYLVIQP